MKKSIIEEIYYNKLDLGKQAEPSEEYRKISDEAYEFYNRLKNILNDEQKRIFEEFTNLEIGVSAEGAFSRFKEGFKIGFLLAIECLS